MLPINGNGFPSRFFKQELTPDESVVLDRVVTRLNRTIEEQCSLSITAPHLLLTPMRDGIGPEPLG